MSLFHIAHLCFYLSQNRIGPTLNRSLTAATSNQAVKHELAELVCFQPQYFLKKYPVYCTLGLYPGAVVQKRNICHEPTGLKPWSYQNNGGTPRSWHYKGNPIVVQIGACKPIT